MIEPLRTSPTAKTPGRLSRGAAGARGVHRRDRRLVGGTSRPVRTKPWSSSATLSPSQSVCGCGADEDEQRPRVELVGARRSALSSTTTRLERAVADQLAHLGVQQHLDVRGPLDPVDEVARHVCAEVVRRGSAGAPSARAGEEHRRLAGRVAAADDRDRVAAHELRLDLRWRRSRRSCPRTPRAAGRRAGGSWAPVAITTALALDASPPSSSRIDVVAVAPRRAPSPRQATASRAPNLLAWIAARSASSAPEMPAGKPR